MVMPLQPETIKNIMIKKDDLIETFLSDPVLRQRFAKHLVLKCFRNSALENLHSGKAPDSKTGDYSDVTVHTPYGVIPWNELSRFNDAEMKVLMQDVVNNAYHFIQELFDEERGGALILKLARQDPLPQWDNPT
jgi:hypothetical protein